MKRLGLLVAFAFAFVLSSCEREQPEADPAAVVQAFVERMQGVHGDPERARDAYELIWSEAKENLTERARRASAVAGRKVGPEEMIAQSRFSLRYRPKRYSAKVSGDWAVVTVAGEAPATQNTQIECVREDGVWRVRLDFPRSEPIQRRWDAG